MLITTRTYWNNFTANISDHRGDSPSRVYRAGGMDAWVLIYTLEGAAITGKNKMSCKPGDVLLIPPGIKHNYGHAENKNWLHMWCYFKPDERLLELLKLPDFSDGMMMLRISDKLIKEKIELAFREIVDLYQKDFSESYNLQLNLLERILLLCNKVNPMKTGNENNDMRLEAVKDFLLRNYKNTVTVDELAELAGISKSRLSVLFKKSTGKTIIASLENIRVQAAVAQLLSGNKTIREISELVGYENPFYFSRLFSKHMGMSPKNFRKIHS